MNNNPINCIDPLGLRKKQKDIQAHWRNKRANGYSTGIFGGEAYGTMRTETFETETEDGKIIRTLVRTVKAQVGRRTKTGMKGKERSRTTYEDAWVITEVHNIMIDKADPKSVKQANEMTNKILDVMRQNNLEVVPSQNKVAALEFAASSVPFVSAIGHASEGNFKEAVKSALIDAVLTVGGASIASVSKAGKGIQSSTHKFKNLEKQLNFLEANIPGLNRAQAKVILEGAHSRGSSAVFGGSRVRGNYKLTSDLDVGFGSLSKAQAGKIIKKANSMQGLSIERTLIVPGNVTPNIKTIISPEEFFMRSGFRSDGLLQFDPRRLFKPYKPSGYISVMP